MEGGKVGHKVGEDGRDSWNKLGVYKTNAMDADDAKGGAEAKEPVDWDLVLDIEFVFLECAIMPDIHDDHEDES